ncbi:MAG: hypothetical protein Rubg2KO_30840 [Rubricoccaceae bacterium]
MTIDKTIRVNAPADQVWTVLGHQFHQADRWASSVDHSAPRDAGPLVGDAPFAQNGRACETSLGPFRETIEHYDEKARSFGYSAEGDKMPFFVKHLQNNWRVHPDGPTRSLVTMGLEARLLPVFAQLMGPIMKRQFGKVTTEATEELKHYIETGQPHPRKVAAAKKAGHTPAASSSPALAT